MKRHLFISLLLSFLVLNVLANDQLSVPTGGFENLQDLKKWATSTWGGGSLETVTLDNKTIHYSWRSFTSGLPTTEIIFFTQQNGKYISFLEIPTQRRELKVEVNNEYGPLIYIKAWDSKSKEYQHALTITKWMIPE
jgi:hypothetical protein